MIAKREVVMFSILVAVAAVSAVSSAAPPEISGKPVVVALEVDVDGSAHERTSMMRREIAINKHIDLMSHQLASDPPTCATNIALDTASESDRAWAGRCKTLAECQDACRSGNHLPGCTAINWWPAKGGCRLSRGKTTPRSTNWTTVSGDADCILNMALNITTTGPHNCTECSSNCVSKQCSAHPECSKLSLEGNCCPSDGDTMLECCEKVYTEREVLAQCSTHAACSDAGLAGACCPTSEGVMLQCCDTS